MNLDYLLPPLIVSGLAGILLAAVLTKGRRSPGNRMFSLVVLLTLLLGLFLFLMRSSPDVGHALLWDKVGAVTAFALFLSYYCFSLELTGNKISKPLLLFFFLTLIAVIAVSPSGFVIQDMRVESYGYAPIVGPGAYLLTGIFIVLIGMAFRRLVKAYRTSGDYEEKNRFLYITLALVFPVVGMFLEVTPTIYPTGIFGDIAFCLLVGVAIFKYHLFDVRIVVRKGLAYLLISAVVAVPYLGAILLGSWILGERQLPLWVYIVLLLILAFALQPLWRGVQRGVDRAFYRGRYDYLSALEKFSYKCTSMIEMNCLSNELVSLTSAAMNINRSYLLVRNSDGDKFDLVASFTSTETKGIALDADSAIVRWLERRDKPLRRSDLDYFPTLEAVIAKERATLDGIEAELFVPFVYQSKLNGILILGPKLSAEPYSADDIAMLMVVARHGSAAIENAYLYAKSQERAMRDGLTGLYNHSYFQERLREEIDRCRRLNRPAVLMMIDIDMFHAYNELHGHAIGDKALSELAGMLRGIARKTDLVFRYGGEEFAVLVPGQKGSKVYHFGERLRGAIESHPFPGLVKRGGLLTVSIGVASYPEHAPDAETLVFCADLALLEAKREGRNCVVPFTPMDVELAPSEDPKQAAIAKSSQVAYISTILALAATIDAKDPFTYGHSQKVAKYAVALGEAIGISSEQIGSLRIAALLHDIGKIGIPDNILRKPGLFSEQEMEEMKKHPKLAANILRHVPTLSHVLHHIVHHHERFDSFGYPDGLGASDISLESRILAIADAFDAMTSPRAHRSASSAMEAIAEMRRCAGTQFDPQLVEVFCCLLEKNPRDFRFQQ